jgi:hypothetical protein
MRADLLHLAHDHVQECVKSLMYGFVVQRVVDTQKQPRRALRSWPSWRGACHEVTSQQFVWNGHTDSRMSPTTTPMDATSESVEHVRRHGRPLTVAKRRYKRGGAHEPGLQLAFGLGQTAEAIPGLAEARTRLDRPSRRGVIWRHHACFVLVIEPLAGVTISGSTKESTCGTAKTRR